MSGKFKQQIPQLAPRDGIDAGGRLVQKKQFWLVQHRATECQPLFPSSGKLCGKPVQIRIEAIHLNDFVHPVFKTLRIQTVNASVKRQIFGDRQIRVQAEIL